MKQIIISVVFIMVIYFFSCGIDNSTNNNPISNTDTSILRTDEFGNIIDGDTTDWCFKGVSFPKLYPVYPNPVYDNYFRVHFELLSDDYVQLYFYNGFQTVYLLNDNYQRGQYFINFYKDSLGILNGFRKLYFKTSYSNCDGDIKFIN